jgi:8-oxo-dGTP diphosphatase
MKEAKYCYDYPRPSVTVDVVCFLSSADRIRVLLVRRGREPFKDCWALPGGFVNMEEDLESSARRELAEETGLQVKWMDQFYTFGKPGRDPRGRTISVAYLAWIGDEEQDGCEGIHGGDDAAEARWFQVEALPKLAFDHDRIIEKARATLKEWQTRGKV